MTYGVSVVRKDEIAFANSRKQEKNTSAKRENYSARGWSCVVPRDGLEGNGESPWVTAELLLFLTTVRKYF